MTNVRHPEKWMQCPKCKEFSGDDWSQCNGVCPVEGSPHWNRAAPMNWGPLIEMNEAEARAAMRERYDAAQPEEVAF